MRKRIKSLILALIMLFLLIPASTALIPAQINSVKGIDFKYPILGQAADATARCYFSEGYFAEKSSIYNPSLATMSLAFELSAWASNEGGDWPDDSQGTYEDKAKNAVALLTEMEFKPEDIYVNDYFKKKPETDSMGVVIGHRVIGVDGAECTLIAMATRGGGYEAEWAGNFDLGPSGQHRGFKTASDIAYNDLEKFIHEHKAEFTGDIKLWIAGYSRGAATAYLLAGRLNKDLSVAGVNFSQENLYAYCFEPPKGAVASDMRYEWEVNPNNPLIPKKVNMDDNIHLIINYNDIVTKVAPSAEGFGFNYIGVDAKTIPTSATTSGYEEKVKRMLTFFERLETESIGEKDMVGERHAVDTFQAKKYDPVLRDPHHCLGVLFCSRCQGNLTRVSDYGKSMGVYLDGAFTPIAFGLGNRQTYVDELESQIKTVLSTVMGKTAYSDKWDDFSGILAKKLMNNISDLIREYIRAESNPFSSESGMEAFVNRAEYYTIKSMEEAGFDANQAADFIPAARSALIVIARTVFNSLSIGGFDDIITFCYNFQKLAPAHKPELCLAWMMSQDENYNGQYEEYINGYRIIRINCPADVNVYGSGDVKMASIIDNEPQDVGQSIVSSFNGDGEKVVYLPADDSYRIDLTATDDGVLSYSVSEYNYESSSISKIVNFYDISIKKGDTLSSVVPEYTQDDLDAGIDIGTQAEYTLSVNNQSLTPNDEVLGPEAASLKFLITAKSASMRAGIAMGSGIRDLGAYAQVCAIANKGYIFDGWYAGNVLLSKEIAYRFRVKEDITITARFVPDLSPGLGLRPIALRWNQLRALDG